jgi:membrane protein
LREWSLELNFKFRSATSIKNFSINLSHKIVKDDIFTSAAALAFYLLLSIFPGLIFLLSLIPFLSIDGLDHSIMNFIAQTLPGEASKMLAAVVNDVTSREDSRLVSFGLLMALWAASTRMYEIMQQLNRIAEVQEARPFWKSRSIATILTLTFGILVVGAFSLIVFGSVIQNYIEGFVFYNNLFAFFFQVLRWIFVIFFMLCSLSLIYCYGPNTKKSFKLFTLGSFAGVGLLILSSLGFRYYVENFANYSRTYGSIGAVIILMFWFYMAGVILLFGSELNEFAESNTVIDSESVK